jgi:hypothetical protein
MADINYPPPIKEIMKPPEWEFDEDTEFLMVERKMMYSYMWIFLVFSTILIMVILF